MKTEVEVLVIGAGQAGLAVGYYLQQHGISYHIIGKEKRIGDVWRNRYDSLTLFTPRAYSSLPGLKLAGDPNGYATKDEIADYLQAYADYHTLSVQLDTEVVSLRQTGGQYAVHTNQGDILAHQVIVATGPFQKPFIPEFAQGLSDKVYQIHTAEYINPSQLQDGSVLVVGGGNSGAQIAVELCEDREVYLSVGHRMKFLPLQLGNRSIFWWFDKLGIYRASIETKRGQWVRRQSDPIFGKELKKLITNSKVKIKAKASSVEHQTFTFADGSHVEVQNVIWATGFHPDYSWVDIPGVLDRNGRPLHERGVSPMEGLYFLGLPWQYRRSSALIGGVGMDAEYLIHRIRGIAN